MNERMFYNALCIATETNHRKLEKLFSARGSWKNAWENLPLSERGAVNPEKEWERADQLGIRLLLSGNEKFPSLLEETPWSPLGIYVRGTLREEKFSIAVVGTRTATGEGKAIAKKFSRELAEAGFAIISGLALGIDGAAHEGCLDARGRTIAVLANGLDQVYPRTHARLAEKILEADGALVSEYPCGAPPFPHRFLERNRIVASLSQGTLVVEAPKNSGSLVTARFALEANRDVFVIPGSISNAHFAGSHELIRTGAHLVTSTEHIREAFGIEQEKSVGKEISFENTEEARVYKALTTSSAPADVDAIIEITGLAITEANRALSMLVIKNIVKETDGGYTLTN